MADGHQIRGATLDDLDALVANCLAVARESEGTEPDPNEARAAAKSALLDPNKARYFVAEDEAGAVVGSLFVTFEWSDWKNGWYWWIQGVYVQPEHRGQGVYSRMYEAVHEAARAAGDVRRIRLYVDKDNEQGLRAYRGHGMEETRYRIFESEVRSPQS